MPLRSDKALGLAFGRNLVDARRRRGVSQERLAFAAGLTRDTIGKLENGRRQPRLATILILCEVLRVEPNELLDGLTAEYEPKLPLP
jgi:transcriptional regulator with XRE-family HTH domain